MFNILKIYNNICIIYMYIEKLEINLFLYKSNESNFRWLIIYYFVYLDMIIILYTNLYVFLYWVYWKSCFFWRILLNYILFLEGYCFFEVVMLFKLFNYFFIFLCVFIMGYYFIMFVIIFFLIICVIVNFCLEFLFL